MKRSRLSDQQIIGMIKEQNTKTQTAKCDATMELAA